MDILLAPFDFLAPSPESQSPPGRRPERKDAFYSSPVGVVLGRLVVGVPPSTRARLGVTSHRFKRKESRRKEKAQGERQLCSLNEM